MNTIQTADKIYNIGKIENANFVDGDKSTKPNFTQINEPEYYIGRDDLLQKVDEKLQKNQAVVLMNGLGGIGKTMTADFYVNQFRDKYEYVAKVFVSGGLCQSLVDGLGKQLGIKFEVGSRLEDQFKIVIARLQEIKNKKKPNLLVLDNANNKDDLVKYKSILKSTGWKVLLTSRCNPTDYEKLKVDELSPADAKELFLHHYPVDEDLSLLLEKINYHTLLIELVAKAGEANCLSIAELLDRLDSGLKHDDLKIKIEIGSHADSPDREKEAELYKYISAMFDPSWFDDDKKLILRYFSVLPAEDIPRNHLERMFGLQDNKFRNNLNELFKFGWLSKKAANYKMHGLVQEVLFEKLEANLKCGDLVRTLSGIMESGDGFQLNLEDAWKYQEYAKSVTQKIKKSDSDIGLLNFYLADFYSGVGQLDSALRVIEVAKEHFKQCGDKESFAISYSRLGEIHQALGQVDKALEFFELFTGLMKQLYDSNPKSESLKNGLAISYSKLGSIHQALGQVDKALEFFELFTGLMKQLYDSNPKNVQLKNGLAISYQKLANIYQTKIFFYKFVFSKYNQPVLDLYKKAITLWQELYQITQLDNHKQKLENAEQAYLQAKFLIYAPLFHATVITIFTILYLLNWLSGWWIGALVILFLPILRSKPKKILLIKAILLILLGLSAWFI